MLTYLTFWTWRKTQAKKNRGPGIFSMLSGYLTCSWSVWKQMETGHWCAHMSVQVLLMSGEKSLINYMRSKYVFFVVVTPYRWAIRVPILSIWCNEDVGIQASDWEWAIVANLKGCFLADSTAMETTESPALLTRLGLLQGTLMEGWERVMASCSSQFSVTQAVIFASQSWMMMLVNKLNRASCCFLSKSKVLYIRLQTFALDKFLVFGVGYQR